jgi:hypothetical protein
MTHWELSHAHLAQPLAVQIFGSEPWQSSGVVHGMFAPEGLVVAALVGGDGEAGVTGGGVAGAELSHATFRTKMAKQMRSVISRSYARHAKSIPNEKKQRPRCYEAPAVCPFFWKGRAPFPLTA